MIMQLFSRKELTFERTYPAPVERVWEVWTRPEHLKQWWGPEKTSVIECDVDLQLGGAIRIVMEADEAMGKYAGTRWPMEGTFTHIDETQRMTYDARSWTEGEENTTIEHTNDVVLTRDGDETVVSLNVTISNIGPGAKMAAFGMRWGYKAQLDKLETYLAS